MDSPLATVVVASYNQAQWLGDAIRSALAQTVHDIEVLVVDNGSTDGSVEIARRFESDPRVTVVSNPTNEAIGRRFNQAVMLARAPFVSFLYSDDLLLPHKIEHQLRRFASLNDDYAVVYGPPRLRNEVTHDEWTGYSVAASGYVLRSLLLHHRRGQIDMVSPLIRRAALVATPFYEDVFAEGEGIFLRLAVSHRFDYTPEPVAVLRDHGGNAGKALVRNHEMTMIGVDRLAADPRLGRREQRWVRAYRQHLELDYGWQGIRLDADLAWARRRLRTALRLRPSPKAAAGLLLALLPASVRSRVNDLAFRARGGRGNAAVVTGYGGGDADYDAPR